MKVHFIGIGGIGTSALAKYYLLKGHKITGSDLVSSEITDYFKKKGVKVFIGKHKAENISRNTDLVIYSPAVTLNNSERKKALKLGIRIRTYPEALGELTRTHFTIAVAGSHGKSTVAAMIGILLAEAGLDPTVIIGTKLKEFNDSNLRMGCRKSKVKIQKSLLVIEADEYFASFLNYWPKMIVLSSLEADHLDFYKTLDNLFITFKRFIAHLPEEGILIANKDDKNIKKILKKSPYKIVYYSLKDKEAKKLKKLLKIPGDFNILNALAALKTAQALKVPNKTSFKSLSQYKGSWRRFNVTEVLSPKPYTLIDDYGHHPTQVSVTLKATREKFPKKEIWCVYQPHQYQRTDSLFNEFVKAFKGAPVNKLIITDIYSVAGREKKEIKKKVSSRKLVKAVNKSFVTYMPKSKIEKFLRKNLKGGEVVIIMGAGDIYDLSLKLKS
jgi:UDP-N-acetylmuramate--alanine ligase